MAANLSLGARRGHEPRRASFLASEANAVTILVAVDAVILLLALGVAAMPFGEPASRPVDLVVAILGLATFPLWKAVLGAYPGHGLSRAQRARLIVTAAVAGFVSAVCLSMVVNFIGDADRPAAALVVGAAFVTMVVSVVADPLTRRVLLRLDLWCQPVFFFGSGDTGAEVARQLKLYPYLGFKPVCMVDDTSIYIPDEQHGVPVIRFSELSRHAQQLGMATTAIVVERLVERSLILQLYTEGIFRRVILIPECHDLISLRSAVRRVGGMLAIEVKSDRPSPLAAWAKRLFDLAFAAAMSLVLLPLLVLIALLIRLDGPGPILFAQPRWGGGTSSFTAFKFRSMHTDGERRLRRYFMQSPAAQREYERFHKLDNDPRVTRIGSFLRATSLDELPQLLNVLRGEMSIVGPRPYTMDELGKLGPARQLLNQARPGITGFWQVSGRNRRTFRERIEMDCYYVRHLSMWLDLWILYRTALGVIARDGK